MTTKRWIGYMGGNTRDKEHIHKMIEEGRFMRRRSFAFFMLATNAVPILYLYYTGVRAGEVSLTEKSRLKARFLRFFIQLKYPSLVSEYIEDYILDEHSEEFRKELETYITNSDNAELETQLSEMSLDEKLELLQDQNISRQEDWIECPITGTILSFEEIVDNKLNINHDISLGLKQFLTGDKQTVYTNEDIQNLKLNPKKDKTKIYALNILNQSTLATQIYNPVDFEVKNVIHCIGPFGKLPELQKSKDEAINLEQKITITRDLYNRQKMLFFGSSPYGLFTLISSLEQLPFVKKGSIQELINENEFGGNDNNIQFRKLEQQQHIYQFQGKPISNTGLGNNLLTILLELPIDKFEQNFAVGQELKAGQPLFKLK